jgi:hypothetical protein
MSLLVIGAAMEEGGGEEAEAGADAGTADDNDGASRGHGLSSMSGGFKLGQAGRPRTLRACGNPSTQNLAIGNKRSAQIEVQLYEVVL